MTWGTVVTSGFMSDNSVRKAKGINLAEFSNFPNKFIVKPQPTALLEHLRRRHRTEHQSTVLKLQHRDTGTQWNLDNIPKPKVITNVQVQPTPIQQISREETFDEDYMMPSRVREILESEGLENRVITSAIGKSEAKHEAAQRKMAEERLSVFPWTIIRQGQQLTTMKPERFHEHKVVGAPSWLRHSEGTFNRELMNREDLSKKYTSGWPLFKQMKLEVEDYQLEADNRKWLKEQGEEQLFFGKKLKCPRVVLISSKIKKCSMLLNICQEDVLPIIYDFDEWTFADIIESVNKKLNAYRKYSKARSVLLYCQGGPGYIYLLRNYAITPQKLQKPSYRSVIDFWKSLGSLLSKLRPAEAVIHLAGFKLLDDQQGYKLLPMLQGIMYPNLVRVEVPDEEKEAGRNTLGQYFQLMKFKIWRSNQSDGDGDDENEDSIETRKKHDVKKLTLSIR